MINELFNSEFLTGAAGNQYFFYAAVILCFAAYFVIRSFLKKKEFSDNIKTREIENEAYLQGVTYLLSKDTDKAIEEFIKAVKVNPDTVATYFAVGTLFRNKGEYSKAIRIHQSIIARPNIDKATKSQAIYNLGLDYKKAGMVQKGIDIFESISKNEKYKIESLYRLEELYEDIKDWDNAVRIVREITRMENLDQTHILAHLFTEKAKGLLRDGDFVEAKKLFKKAISLNSRCIDAYLHLGDLYFAQEDYLKSIHTWKQVLGINSFFTHLAYPRLEEAYFRLGKYDTIEKLLKDNLSKNKNDAYCHLALGKYYVNKGNVEDALFELNEALAIDPNFIDAKKELTNIYIQKDMIEELKTEFTELLRSLPSKYNSYRCNRCGYVSYEIVWKCPQCRKWDTIVPDNIRKVS